jgi:hypothetical protein
VVGPLVATALLAVGLSMRAVFAVAIVPGVIATALVAGVREADSGADAGAGAGADAGAGAGAGAGVGAGAGAGVGAGAVSAAGAGRVGGGSCALALSGSSAAATTARTGGARMGPWSKDAHLASRIRAAGG